MIKERIERAIKLADELQFWGILQKFNMEEWAEGHHAIENGGYSAQCGTSACFMGWCTTVPEFREAGLELGFVGGMPCIIFQEHHGFEAAAEFFEIDLSEAINIFHPDGYRTWRRNIKPIEVADKLRALLNRDNNG